MINLDDFLGKDVMINYSLPNGLTITHKGILEKATQFYYHVKCDNHTVISFIKQAVIIDINVGFLVISATGVC